MKIMHRGVPLDCPKNDWLDREQSKMQMNELGSWIRLSRAVSVQCRGERLGPSGREKCPAEEFPQEQTATQPLLLSLDATTGRTPSESS